MSKNTDALVYPIEHQDRYSASITFHPHRITPPTVSESLSETVQGKLSEGLDAVKSEGVNILGDLSSYSIVNTVIDGVTSFAKGVINSDVTAKSVAESVTESTSKAIKEVTSPDEAPSVVTPRGVNPIGPPIKLYLPTALTFNDGLNYDTPPLRQVGATAFGLASQGEVGIKAGLTALGSGATSVLDAALGRSSGADVTRLGILRLADKASSAVAEGISIAAAVTMNPNTRAAFKGVAIREFSFSFKFIPKSYEESKMVGDIIKAFRLAAYPEPIQAAGINYGYKFPDLFDIKVKYVTENGVSVRVGQTFQKCFLKGIATTYNPSTMSFHADGSPVEIDLTLNFVEEKTIDRSTLEEEYKEFGTSGFEGTGGI